MLKRLKVNGLETEVCRCLLVLPKRSVDRTQIGGSDFQFAERFRCGRCGELGRVPRLAGALGIRLGERK